MIKKVVLTSVPTEELIKEINTRKLKGGSKIVDGLNQFLKEAQGLGLNIVNKDDEELRIVGFNINTENNCIEYGEDY